MNKSKWIWMPHAGHLIVGSQCRFHLNTYLGNGYLVSTVGEWWPDRVSREIHADVYDPHWLQENRWRKGDDFDHAYMQRFGFMEIGADRKYETMVFKARQSERQEGWECCPWEMISGDNADYDSYNTATDAYIGHLEMCDKWSRKGQKNEVQHRKQS